MGAAASTAPPHSRKRSGIDLFACGLLELALVEFDRAVVETPADAEAHNYRARVLDAMGRYEEALRAIDKALAIHPSNVADLKNRGVLLRKLGQLPQALESFDAAQALCPQDIDLLLRRAHVLSEVDRREEALACAEQALAQAPDDLLVLNARGMVLEQLGRYADALADFERMLALQPDHVDAINNRGMVLARQGQYAQALEAYTRSLAIQPDQAQAFYNRSLLRLAMGDWSQGFVEFESRWNLMPLKAAQPATAAPLWLGREELHGKTLLLHHEQGYGDTLQCVRYVPRLVELGARVILAVPPALLRLMRSLPGSPAVVPLGGALPAHDYRCPLMSLPLAFATTPHNVPSDTPYLRPDATLVQRWRERLGAPRRPRIGLAWSGRRYAPINYPRDMALSALRPLFALDAEFIALQQELSAQDRALLAELPHLNVDLAGAFEDFADTAALIEQLDLVISVDTAVAHLAGALGKPVWLMNRYASCWRWLLEGSQTSWYPSMRIFRQRAVGDWGSVVQDLCAAASQLPVAAAPQTPSSPAISHISTQRTAGAEAPRGSEAIRFICATRHSQEEFFAKGPLGRSLPLYRTFPRRQRIELRLFPANEQGLPSVYNLAIEESKTHPAVLVFIHDDVYLSDYYWSEHLLEGLRHFDVVGLAGNRRRVAGQASWMYLNDRFQSDSYDHLSGVLGHGDGFPNLKQLSVYGEPGQEVKLLDGVLLAVRSTRLIESGLRFDERFTFDFYDMDFCRQAELRSLRMGTWAISAIHASAGKLGGEAWRGAYRQYLNKYAELEGGDR